MKNTIGRQILASGLCVAWAICFTAKYLVPAILMAGTNYGNPREAYNSFVSTVAIPLSVASWILLVTAIVAIAWSFVGVSPDNTTEG
jgi:nucleoside recognition membrane protein YjiH